jgi:hypothetical protein
LGFCAGWGLQSSFDSTLENGGLGLTQSSMLSSQQAEDHVLYRDRPRSPFHFRYAWIIGAFVPSRVLYLWAGIRFDTHILVSNFEFIDLPLLRTQLFDSLFYFYMQPPRMNLLVGTAIKAFTDNYCAALHALYLAAGLSSAILPYIIMPRLGVNAAWIRNLCPLFFILLFAVSAFFLAKHRSKLFAAAAIPAATALPLFIKKRMVLGLFSSSSWLANNLVTVTIHQLTDAEKISLIEQKNLAPGAPATDYRPVLFSTEDRQGVRKWL